MFATVSCPDSMSPQSFKKGIEQLSEEGFLHLFTSRTIGSGYPIIGALEIYNLKFQRRLQDEYNAKVALLLCPMAPVAG